MDEILVAYGIEDSETVRGEKDLRISFKPAGEQNAIWPDKYILFRYHGPTSENHPIQEIWLNC